MSFHLFPYFSLPSPTITILLNSKDNEDDADDKEGIKDPIDRCPKGIIGRSSAGQDLDGDGCIDSIEDDDDDQDGVLDALDNCPLTKSTESANLDGCSQYQLDDDDDGISNAYDFCLNTSPGRIVDTRGCEVSVDSASSENDGNGIDLTSVLFVLAAGLVGLAVVTTMRRPQIAPLPPTRPKDIVNIQSLDDESE